MIIITAAIVMTIDMTAIPITAALLSIMQMIKMIMFVEEPVRDVVFQIRAFRAIIRRTNCTLHIISLSLPIP